MYFPFCFTQQLYRLMPSVSSYPARSNRRIKKKILLLFALCSFGPYCVSIMIFGLDCVTFKMHSINKGQDFRWSFGFWILNSLYSSFQLRGCCWWSLAQNSSRTHGRICNTSRPRIGRRRRLRGCGGLRRGRLMQLPARSARRALSAPAGCRGSATAATRAAAVGSGGSES